jgi:uncharacterized protein (DUF305 family)
LKRYTSLGLLTLLLLTLTLALASCGGSGSAQQGQSDSDDEEQASQESTGDDMHGMEHGEMTGMEMGSGRTAPKDLIVDGEYSDERFIDMMAAHHQMAIDMARVAQQNAQLPAIQRIANDIVATQQAEIEVLASLKQTEFGSSEVPMMMNPEEPSMYAMAMPDELAQQEPFDLAFIDSMIPHHASAIEMASTANRRSETPEIKRLARSIIDAQSQEIGEMIELRQANYPEAHPLA